MKKKQASKQRSTQKIKINRRNIWCSDDLFRRSLLILAKESMDLWSENMAHVSS